MNNPKIEIRRIRPQDRDDFLLMVEEFYNSPAVMHDIDHDYYSRAFDELMRSDVYLDCYIFVDNDKPVGYALLTKTFSQEGGGLVIWIDELYVRKEYRSHGIGSMFFDWMHKNLPAARYRLEVEPDNERAQALYRRMGYETLPYMQMVLENGSKR